MSCQLAFGCYEADMEHLLVAPEEIFVEAASVLDDVLSYPETAEGYIGGLWNTLKINIRHWDSTAPQNEVKMVSGAILYVVATALLQHWHGFFRERLVNQLMDIAEKNMGVTAEEEQRFILELSKGADGLSDWMMEYVDSEERLSEGIEKALNPDTPEMHCRTMSEDEWDASLDDVFDNRLNPMAIFKALKNEITPNVSDFYPRFFVYYRVLDYLHWLVGQPQAKFLRWANLHWGCGWDVNSPSKFKFSNNIAKPLRDEPLSDWYAYTVPNSTLGEDYRDLADRVINHLANTVKGEWLRDKTEFYKDGETDLINNGDLKHPYPSTE
ncbi:MAG: hypothetical protein IKO85_04735 [Bacteroidaceae bacterium]|nr:hypothetical protein [Bacteroidaceae bacterium]